MLLPQDALILPEKLTRYLLASRKRNDKSKWLAKVGYIPENWRVLECDLRRQILTQEAIATENTLFGQMFEISGRLTGPNGGFLSVSTIWMKETATGITKFITMYPDKRAKT